MQMPKLWADGVLGDYVEMRGIRGVYGSFTWGWTVPPGLWLWQWARLDSLVTDATVTNRSAHLFIMSHPSPSSPPPRMIITDEGAQTAGNTRTHLWVSGSSLGSQQAVYVIHRMPPNLIIPPRHTIAMSVTGTQAGDSATDAHVGLWRIGAGH